MRIFALEFKISCLWTPTFGPRLRHGVVPDSSRIVLTSVSCLEPQHCIGMVLKSKYLYSTTTSEY